MTSGEVTAPVVAVTGAAGMLGSDVVLELKRRGISPIPLTRADCDITDPDSVLVALKMSEMSTTTSSVSAIIHCAAYTDVNRAESEYELARRINAEGAGAVAEACAQLGARMVLISTDYVFDGQKPEPYVETDEVAPLNAYGRSKLAGEELAVAAAMGLVAVARTSWLFGKRGKNFVTTMLALARQGRDLSIVADQIGAPTYTGHLARAVVDLALASTANAPRTQNSATGIFHVTAGGECSWFEFAGAIFELSGVHPQSLSPVPASQFPTPALRPPNSRLRDTRLSVYGIEPMPHWRNGLATYLAEIGELAGGARQGQEG